MSAIEIYKSGDNDIEIQVLFERDTVWLTQKQIVELFESSKANISEHIKHIFKENELSSIETVRKFRTVQKEGSKSVSRELDHYSLDIIISIGYRVNSKRGTQFRQWATQRLKDFLLKGYAVNQTRLEQLQQIIQLVSASGNTDDLKLSEAKGLLDIIRNYTQSFILLNQYDSHTLPADYLDENITYEIQFEEVFAAITELKKQLIAAKEATELFGKMKDESFKGILGNVVQSFGGAYLYPSIEEQAANLLYFIIKNHPFNDGNKRIGAFIFVWFLEKNKHRFKKSGELKINDNALVALALLVAQSNPAEKQLMVQLITNLVK